MHYSSLEMSAFGVTLPMIPLQQDLNNIQSFNKIQQVENDISFIGDDVFSTQIADARYEEMDLQKYVSEYCTHLNHHQQEQLLQLLQKHKKLFDGSLGCYEGDEMDIPLQPGTKPVWNRPYPVRHHLLEIFQK